MNINAINRVLGFLSLIALAPLLIFSQTGQKQTISSAIPVFTVIPYEDATGLLIVPVTIEGKTYRFLFDTGAFTAIAPELDSILQLKKEGQINFVDANNIAGSASFIDLKDIAVGSLKFFNKRTALFASPLFKCLGIEGVLGNDLLSNYIVMIDPVKKQITITDQLNKLTFSRNKAAGSPVTLTQQKSPFIDTRLTHETTGAFVTVFDTGFRGFYQVSRLFAADPEMSSYFRVLDSGRIKGSNSLSVYDQNIETLETHYRMLLPELHIGNARFLDVPVQSMDKPYNALGVELLKYGACILDNKNKKFYFLPDKTTINMGDGEWPVSLGLSDDNLIITYVWDPKLRSQLEIGDQILAIGNHSYDGNNFCDLLTRIPFPDNADSEAITIKDQKGNIRKVILKKEDYD
ncbi:hypothetical protein A8C56_05145 [Niabella ginsenosidivorans]|uniref:PDZ domain-containing protein n=1 Tax=Niabella ginsenosidivorans TaxID=1176587 RepID=A0A1A9HYG0_9BACT|nr:retropepsin-like aspartic protease [Niabella ginsenosidivorans]ANH80458.1 hypothetical protein A8C56_05145 [Niabella ginsenosidivorans]